MTDKRFEFREINEPPILPKCYDTEKQEYANLFECVGWLNELHEENEERKRAMRIAEHYNEQLLDENKKLKKYLDSISKGGLE